MSHEEPDLETKEPPHDAPPGHPPDLRGDLDVRTIAVGVVVAAIMGASYPYMVLKLGFGPNVSVVAAFFGFLFLRAIDLVIGSKHYNRWQNNLAEAAGTSAAQTAFMCVLLGAFDILRHNKPEIFQMELTPFDSFLWLSAACSLGVLMAVPLRRHFVVDEKLPYVDGLATAETMVVLDPPKEATAEVKKNAVAAFKAVMLGVALSGVLMFFREDAQLMDVITHGKWHGLPEGWNAPWTFFKHIEHTMKDGQVQDVVHGVILARLAVGASYSLLSIGSGMIVGLRINLSMMLGGVLAYVVAPYFLIKHGVALHHVEDPITHHSTMVLGDTPTRNEILFWVMWPATGMLVVGGLTALALRWKILIETFKSLRGAKIGKSELPLSVVGIGVAFCSIMLCVVQAALLGMPVWMTLLAILMSIPLMLVGLRVLGETNWGPISALSNMMQGLFAAIAPGNVAANMVASGTTGTIATSSEAIMQDYKCGDVIGTKPRNLTIMQLIAVPVGAAAVSWVYPALVKTYHLFDWTDAKGVPHGPGLTSPISNKWSGFATILKEGASALPTSALYALVIFSVLGIIFTVAESNPKLKNWVPSPTGIGIGMLVPFSVISTMFIGGIMGWAWERWHKKSADTFMVPLASGLIAGEAIVAVIGAIYLYFAVDGQP
ncbi:MAG TPA: OPT family oligopeptide transporter [Kofleriaceae bacterium]|nr:OPT family oligopeptide transporter [Kofleriaceae bacterium]